jgi:hypothetical protein
MAIMIVQGRAANSTRKAGRKELVHGYKDNFRRWLRISDVYGIA